MDVTALEHGAILVSDGRYRDVVERCRQVSELNVNFLVPEELRLDSSDVGLLRGRLDPEARALLGVCFFRGMGVDEDRGQAVACFREAAEAGNPIGQSWLAVLLKSGIPGVLERDEREAVRLMREAVDQGFAAAKNRLAVWLWFGVPEVLDKDEHEAVRLMREAVDQGFAAAKYNLGCWRWSGVPEVLDKDEHEAVRLMREAADQGNAAAKNHLAAWLKSGIPGVLEKDEHEAVRLMREAADQGNASAKYNLALWLESGISGVLRKEKHEAVQLMREAAKQGNALAKWWLACGFKDGIMDGDGISIVLEKDEHEAVRLMREAADLGVPTANNHLAVWLKDGIPGVLGRDRREAVRLMRGPADQGAASARYVIATATARRDGDPLVRRARVAAGAHLGSQQRIVGSDRTSSSSSPAVEFFLSQIAEMDRRIAELTAQTRRHQMPTNPFSFGGQLLQQQPFQSSAPAAPATPALAEGITILERRFVSEQDAVLLAALSDDPRAPPRQRRPASDASAGSGRSAKRARSEQASGSQSS
jgi:TPR repeat protein